MTGDAPAPSAGIAAVFDEAGRRAVSQPAGAPETGPAGSRIWRELAYAAPVGYRRLALDLRVPAAGGGPFPLVIYLHGGAWMHQHRNELPETFAAARPFDRLVEAGYAVAAAAYRLSGEARFPAQLHDVKAAVRWLRFHAEALDLDPARIAAWGLSSGAHLACLLGTTAGRPELDGTMGVTGPSSAVQAVVDWYGPTDPLLMDAQRIAPGDMPHDAPGSPESRLLGAPIQSVPDLARTASAVHHASAAASPFLIVHGEEDHLVPVGQARALADALRGAGADVTLHTVPGADHVFRGFDDVPGLVDEMIAFLDARLRPGSGRDA